MSSFVRQIRRRSEEHATAVVLISEAGLAAPAIAILRQEVDSLVRVIFLLTQPLADRTILIHDSVSGNRWRRPGSRAFVTDQEMVELSMRLVGWTQSVYKFGCAFVHLSNLHNYDDGDLLSKLPLNEREDILTHLRYYHGGPTVDNPALVDLLPMIPRVLGKISDNLTSYINKLEAGESLDTSDFRG
jgi:hypothetical protein